MGNGVSKSTTNLAYGYLCSRNRTPRVPLPDNFMELKHLPNPERDKDLYPSSVAYLAYREGVRRRNKRISRRLAMVAKIFVLLGLSAAIGRLLLEYFAG